MSFVSDYELNYAKQDIANMKQTFLDIIDEANNRINKITTEKYGGIQNYIDSFNRIIGRLENYKTKYPQAVTELQGYIDTATNQLNILQSVYTTKIGSKVL